MKSRIISLIACSVLSAVIASVFLSCSSTYIDRNDYDSETYDYISETDREYIGQFSYTGFTYAWKDFTQYQLTERVRKSAVRKYGRNIVLRNVEISDGRKSMIAATSLTAVAGIIMISAGSEVTTTVQNGVEKDDVSMSAVGGAGMGMLFAAPVFMLFKRYKITADVYRNAAPYIPARVDMIDKDDFDEQAALRRASNEAKLKQEKARSDAADRIARHEVWVGMTKDQLIMSRGEPNRASVKDDGIVADTARLSAGVGAINGHVAASAAKSTARVERVQVYYYPGLEIYIKNNVVTEIYDTKE